MCDGGRFLACFSAGTVERPDVHDVIAGCLTPTADGTWVIWAHKLAGRRGAGFVPLTGGDPYPVDAVARCRRGGGHQAPDVNCSCGFHALSIPFLAAAGIAFGGIAWYHRLEVVLSGRILAFEWEPGGVLFRAERQTVMRAEPDTPPPPRADPSGWLAALPTTNPRGVGPVSLRLPQTAPPTIALGDDAGYCALQSDRVLAGVP